ncbi:hypothetical protein EOL70_05560 [Leucothrix sargassi]|nr:hypothetical protein EOL70_05560 [Leucothrix sargassi]
MVSVKSIRYICLALGLFAAMPVSSADKVIANPWVDAVDTAARATSFTDTSNKNVLTLASRPLSVEFESLATQLHASSDFIFSLPLPDGTFAEYQFKRSSVMASGLAAKYPSIQTFTATDVTNPSNKGRFDITPKGFHGMFKHDGRWVFVDPELRDSSEKYLSYYGDNAVPLVGRSADIVFPSTPSNLQARTETAESAVRAIAGDFRRTYRIAISAAAEYVAFHGGTKEDGLAAIVTMLNRVNEVYERDLSIVFELVENNDEVIFTNTRTDPFGNSDFDVELNPNVLDETIGSDQYDLGHVLNTGGGGLAALGVCDPELKALGMTGTNTPTGDAFYIDYVAHELGHQLGANHSFNGTNTFCRGNRNAATAWEPGSGSSIMSYAGICGDQNIQANASAFFHIGSIEEIELFTAEAGCGVETAIENTAPVVDAGADYVIPSNTPFRLAGTASDVDGDTLSYIWEQLDTGTASADLDEMVDDGTRPLFRSWEFESHGERYLPRLQDVLVDEGYTTVGESYPNSDRDLTFRLTVRDGQGGISTDEAIVSVNHGSDAFRVTSPQAGDSYTGGEELTIAWDVAGTNAAPINCSAVEILLSDNAGISFDEVLAASTPNDGEYKHTITDEDISDARVMVSCLDNVFYAVNTGEFDMNATGVRESSSSGSSDSGGSSSFSWLLLVMGVLAAGFRQRYSLKYSTPRRH